MKVKNFAELVDYPDDIVIILYDYAFYDTVFEGLIEDIPSEYLEREVRGFEIPSKNSILLNI